jgi:Ser/Thr protein kinase RdoA (MazF antagonist)
VVTAWSEELAETLADDVLAAVGIVSAETSVIRFRSAFASIRVERPPLLVKVGAAESDGAVLERSLNLGRFLREAGVPVATPAVELAAGPVRIGERWAGFWYWEQSRPGQPNPAATGRALRRMHEALGRCPVPVADLDPIVTSRERLDLVREGGSIPASSVDFLSARLARMSDAWDRFETQPGVSPIHGDFKLSNLMSTPKGPLILDLDDVRVAPWEWDLATISRSAHDGWSAEQWRAFSAGFGHDHLLQPNAEPLRQLTHLGALIFQLARHRSPQRLRRGRALLDQWLRDPARGCHELDWDGAFRRFPDPPATQL